MSLPVVNFAKYDALEAEEVQTAIRLASCRAAKAHVVRRTMFSARVGKDSPVQLKLAPSCDQPTLFIRLCQSQVFKTIEL